MNSLFKAEDHSGSVNIAILVLRVGIAVLMLVHGLPKLMTLVSGEPVQFPALIGTPAISLGLAVFAEVICSILILMGLATRLATIPLIITMLVAVLYIHGADPFAKQEMGLHYLIGYVVLLLTGSGRYSLDNWINKPKSVLAYS